VAAAARIRLILRFHVGCGLQPVPFGDHDVVPGPASSRAHCPGACQAWLTRMAADDNGSKVRRYGKSHRRSAEQNSVIAVYDDHDDALRALQALKEAGCDDKHVSVMGQRVNERHVVHGWISSGSQAGHFGRPVTLPGSTPPSRPRPPWLTAAAAAGGFAVQPFSNALTYVTLSG
jgi:hypothetical protein